MASDKFIRIWSILAVRGIVLGVIFLESVPALLASFGFCTYYLRSHAISGGAPYGFGGVWIAWVWGVIIAWLCFLLSIRLTQSLLRFRVTLSEWGVSGLLSANLMVVVMEYVYHSHRGQWWDTCVLALAVSCAVTLCILLQSRERSEYSAAPSLIPFGLSLEEQERRRRRTVDMLAPIRNLVDQLEFHEGMEAAAREAVLRIPARCPFERDVGLFGRTLFHIPPLCKLNPLFEELVSLRFRALVFLEHQGEDVQRFL